MYPNCRCSIAGHVDDEEFFDFMDELGVEFTDEELEFLGRSRKNDGKDYSIPRRDDASPLDEKKYYKTPKDDNFKFKIENSVESPEDYSRISKTRYRRTDGIEYQNGIYHSNASLIGNTEIKHEMVTETYFIYDKNGGTMIEEKRPKFDYSKYPHDENGKLTTKTVNRRLPKKLDPNTVYDVVTSKGDINRTFTNEEGQRVLRIDSNDHGKPRTHPMGAHKHYVDSKKKKGVGTDGPAYNLNDEDEKENDDILWEEKIQKK